MRFLTLAANSMTFGIFAAMICFAGPVAAAPASWVMPEVRGMVLSQAVKAVRAATGPGLNLVIRDLRNGQEVINQTNWDVCGYFPPEGQSISQKTKRVVLYVKRFNQQRCAS